MPLDQRKRVSSLAWVGCQLRRGATWARLAEAADSVAKHLAADSTQ